MAKTRKQMGVAAYLAFMEAWQFEQVAELLTSKLSKGSIASAPIVMNCAFSIEVYFKCLYMIQKEEYPPHVHDLQELYDKLTKENQTAIVELYAQGVAKEPQWAHLPFTMVLDWAKKAFVEWRYDYERWRHRNPKSRAFANGEILCEAVRERIVQLKPDWKNFLHDDFA